MKIKAFVCRCALLAAVVFPRHAGVAADVQAAIQSIRQLSTEGQGNALARPAVQLLGQQEIAVLPELLRAMDGANDLAANWLRSAAESIVQRERKLGKPLPVAALGNFLLDVRHDPKPRELAYDFLAQIDPAAANSLQAGMLNDPSMDLRRGAIQKLVDQAAESKTNGNTIAATLLYQQALAHVRDVDQIEKITEGLKLLGQKTDLAALFGWVQSWKVIGPFDNTKREGFEKVFPPENEINLNATYDGKEGKVRWQDLNGADEYGKIDVNLPLGKLKETIAYCYTELNASRAQPVEIRLGCKNAWKVWLNGKLLFGRDEYHRGAEIDQYRLPAELKAGKNTLLVKLGQNEQKEEWTVEWEFQLRVTDGLGTPVTPLRVGVPPPTTAALLP